MDSTTPHFKRKSRIWHKKNRKNFGVIKISITFAPHLRKMLEKEVWVSG